MASTNKTANLQLNQWVLTDPLLMEDMNSDNQKIDAAVGASPCTKLMDVTTSANAQLIDLDVSGLDLTKYAMIHIFAYNLKVTPLSTAMFIYARINGGGAYLKSITDNGNPSSSGYIGYAISCTGAVESSSMKLELSCFPSVATDPCIILIKSIGAGRYNETVYLQEHIGARQFGANERINTININTNNSEVFIKAGARFEIYGVKK